MVNRFPKDIFLSRDRTFRAARPPRLGAMSRPEPFRQYFVRLAPQWYADAGPISIYYTSRTLMPAKTRVFLDFVVDAFRRQRLAERFAGSIG